MDLNGIYRAVVENNNDPLKVGRVQVRIFGFHTENKTRGATDGIPTEHLPWAEPCLPVAEGAISGYGIWCVPLQGSHVMVFFENGQLNKPIYFGSLPGITTERPQNKGFYDPAGKYPDKTGSDFHSKAKGKYPHNFVIAVHGGHYIEIDSTPGNERLKVFHKKGTNTEINSDGSVNITIVDDETKQVSGDMTETVTGAVSETYQNGQTVNITGNCSITATGTVTVTSPTVIVTGGTVALANQATQLKLVNETGAAVFNSHTHNESGSVTGTPNQSMGSTSVTSNTTAS